MAKSPKVSVVIPSWNSESQLKSNLPAVFMAAKQVGAEIIVVDDFSRRDDSAKYLKSLGDQIRFYQNKTNQGFSYTVNRGVKLAGGEYVILLNTDVKPAIDCFQNALKYFRDSGVFAVTFNSDESWAAGRFREGLMEHYPVKADDTNRNHANRSLWASGGQAAFNRDKWLQLGGMDLMYRPFYWEDVDMGYRAWKRGWKIHWAPDCQADHDHRQSVIAESYSRYLVRETAQRNQFLFVWKNIHDRRLLLSHLARLPSFLKNYPKPFLGALRLLPSALASRQVEKSASVLSDRSVLSNWS